MGLMSDDILGGRGDCGSESSKFKAPTRTVSLNRKSYLFNPKEKQKGVSQNRRDAIKSSLFKALDHDDTSTTCDILSDEDGGELSSSGRGPGGSNLRRSKSLENGTVNNSFQPKLRGKKSDLVGSKLKHSSSTPPAGSSSTDRAPARTRPTGSQSDHTSSTRKKTLSLGSGTTNNANNKPITLPNRSRRERSQSDVSSLVINMSRQDTAESAAAAAAPPHQRAARRKSSMGFLVGSFSKHNNEEEEEDKSRCKIQQQQPEIPTTKRGVVKRSMSLGWDKKAQHQPHAHSSTDPSRSSLARDQKGKGSLGNFLSNKQYSHDNVESDDDDDDSSDGGNSTTSWITWAASAAVSTALKPLERLYDDINDKGSKRGVVADDDGAGDGTEDESEFPNTEAEAFSATKLSTTEKIAGLRFVASRQRRKSLYI